MDNYERHMDQSDEDRIDVICPTCSTSYHLTYGGWVGWRCECGTEIRHPDLKRYNVTVSVKVYCVNTVEAFTAQEAQSTALDTTQDDYLMMLTRSAIAEGWEIETEYGPHHEVTDEI